MALDARSSLGTKISLLSNSEIRYEGYLCALDQVENTVSLRDVTIFGTEGRKGGMNEVAGSNQTYELIVFRGSDIHDLTVFENPTPANLDPAILSVSAPTGAPAAVPMQAAGAVGGFPQQQQQQQPKSFAAVARNAPPQQVSRGFYDEAPARQSHYGNNGGRYQGAGGGRGGGGYQRRGGYGGRGRGGGHYRRNNDSHTGMDFAPAPEGKKEAFKEEFDFEKARQEFEAKKKELEAAREEAKHHSKVYDKSSFFDNISGDQKDRGASRMDREEMKKADTETFGSDMVGRMHGGGYRGRGRGGRGRYNRF